MHRRNQNGRSNGDSGQGSRGKGAFATSRFGEPGLVGEWISEPKRWIPSVDNPSTMNADAVGIGIMGAAIDRLRRGLEEILSGGFGDTSAGSGTDTERILFLRLDDEKFFFRPFDPEVLTLKRPGESGIEGMLSKLSAEVTFVRAGVAGIVLGVPSAGLGVGSGDDPLRLIIVWLILEVDDLKARLGSVPCGCDVVKADFGGSGNGCMVSSEGSDEGSRFGAAVSGAAGALVLVSIFNCLTLRPDSLRSLTPGLVIRLDGLVKGPLEGIGVVIALCGGGGSAPRGGGCIGGGSIFG